jgi:hypothetical protein
MNQPRYYAGEFDGDRKMNGAFVLVVVLLLCAASHYAAFWAGGELAVAAERETQRLAAEAPKATSAAVAKPDWSQFNCRELINICRKRYEAKR